MNIQLYQCTSPTIAVSKSLKNATTFSGHFTDESSIIDPILLIESNNIASDKFNYMHIAQFNRYYYIYSIDAVRTNLWRITGHCDVLMSFSTDIKASSQFIERNEIRGKRNKRLPDSNIPLTTKRQFDCIQFGNKFIENSYYVLTTMASPPKEG